MENSVSSYAKLIKDAIDSFVISYERSEDPISSLLGPEGSWLLSNPSLDIDDNVRKQFMVDIVSDINKVILKNSEDRYQIYNADITKTSITISIGNSTYSDLIIWSLFDNKLVIKDFDEAINLELDNRHLNEKLSDVQLEFDETKIILSDSNNLLNNGLYTIYLKSVFRRFKYKKDVANLLNDLQQDIMMYNTNIEHNSLRIEELSLNDNLLELINVMNVSFKRFPYIKAFDDYKVLKKDSE